MATDQTLVLMSMLSRQSQSERFGLLALTCQHIVLSCINGVTVSSLQPRGMLGFPAIEKIQSLLLLFMCPRTYGAITGVNCGSIQCSYAKGHLSQYDFSERK
jgi:hypothetical protein